VAAVSGCDRVEDILKAMAGKGPGTRAKKLERGCLAVGSRLPLERDLLVNHKDPGVPKNTAAFFATRASHG
jgi:hypothetical protein